MPSSVFAVVTWVVPRFKKWDQQSPTTFSWCEIVPAAVWGTCQYQRLHTVSLTMSSLLCRKGFTLAPQRLSLQWCAGSGCVAAYTGKDERRIRGILQFKVCHCLMPTCPVKQNIKSHPLIPFTWYTKTSYPWMLVPPNTHTLAGYSFSNECAAGQPDHGAAILVCFLSMKSRKRLAHDITDNSATHASIVRDLQMLIFQQTRPKLTLKSCTECIFYSIVIDSTCQVCILGAPFNQTWRKSQIKVFAGSSNVKTVSLKHMPMPVFNVNTQQWCILSVSRVKVNELLIQFSSVQLKGSL